MLFVTVQVDAPPGQAMGIKEDLAVYLERFGDVKGASVQEEAPKQLRFEDFKSTR